MPALKRRWPSVQGPGGPSCGGNQNWFPDANFRRCGCGVIACADTLLYLTGRETLSRQAYLDYVAGLRKYFPLIPGRGIDGLRLSAGMNLCLRRAGLPLRTRWCGSFRKFQPRLEELLTSDLPAVTAIGPNFPRFWGAERLPLYEKTPTGFVEVEQVKAHFLTVTAAEGRWLTVSTWGRRLYLDRESMESYMRRVSSPLLTNVLYIQKV